jgi:hypothetical protein
LESMLPSCAPATPSPALSHSQLLLRAQRSPDAVHRQSRIDLLFKPIDGDVRAERLESGPLAAERTPPTDRFGLVAEATELALG